MSKTFPPPSPAVPQPPQGFRSIPRECRLRAMQELMIAELESLGYELAHDVDTQTVTSVFTMVTDFQNRMQKVQGMISREALCTQSCASPMAFSHCAAHIEKMPKAVRDNG